MITEIPSFGCVGTHIIPSPNNRWKKLGLFQLPGNKKPVSSLNKTQFPSVFNKLSKLNPLEWKSHFQSKWHSQNAASCILSNHFLAPMILWNDSADSQGQLFDAWGHRLGQRCLHYWQINRQTFSLKWVWNAIVHPNTIILSTSS